jgi:hypothetical protein
MERLQKYEGDVRVKLLFWWLNIPNQCVEHIRSFPIIPLACALFFLTKIYIRAKVPTLLGIP